MFKDLARKVTPPLLWRAAARLKPSQKLPSIVIIIPYFGKFPPWINFLIESIRWNADIKWVIFTDCDLPENSAPNLEFQKISFADYKQKISNKLGLRFNPKNPYKLCDVRPALSYVHDDLCKDYVFTGFGDLDVIYGNIRSVYTSDLLNTYDFLSAHRDHISGHFFLMRNTQRIAGLFQKIPKWEENIVKENYCHLDEDGFAQAVMSVCAQKRGVFKRAAPKVQFEERYTTPLPHGTMRWVWKDGILSNEFYRREQNSTFVYLHFLFWHSSKWFPLERALNDAVAPWEKIDEIVKMDWRLAGREGFMISQSGIETILVPMYS